MFRVIQEMRQVKGIQIVRVRLKTVKNEVIGTVLNNDRFSVCNAESKAPDFCIGEHFIARRIMPIAIVKGKLNRKGIRQIKMVGTAIIISDILSGQPRLMRSPIMPKKILPNGRARYQLRRSKKL